MVFLKLFKLKTILGILYYTIFANTDQIYEGYSHTIWTILDLNSIKLQIICIAPAVFCKSKFDNSLDKVYYIILYSEIRCTHIPTWTTAQEITNKICCVRCDKLIHDPRGQSRILETSLKINITAHTTPQKDRIICCFLHPKWYYISLDVIFIIHS